QQPRDLNLPACRREQIVAANDQRDALQVVVDRRCKLVRPLSLPIADQHVTALLRWPLLLGSMPYVLEALDRRVEPHTRPQRAALRQMLRPARAWVTELAGHEPGRCDLASRALAGVHHAF